MSSANNPLLQDQAGHNHPEMVDLKRVNDELDRASRMLVRKDLELSRANERLRELDKTKSEFISVAAHQLRTPLSAVKWIFSMLLEDAHSPLSDEQKSLVRKGFESNERMIRLINDLLTVSRIEAGKFRYQFFPLRLSDIVASVIEDFKGPASDRNIELVYVEPEADLPIALLDPEKMRSALQNLIENAVKYTLAGGTVTVRLDREGESVRCSVSDTGIGIAKADQPKMFSRFFRSASAMKIETDGSGLGLFITRTIVERHGGRVWFETEEGKGTTFFFTIPNMKTPSAIR